MSTYLNGSANPDTNGGKVNDLRQEIERRYNTTCHFMLEEYVGHVNSSWWPSRVPSKILVRSYAFLKGVEGHTGVVAGYAWVETDGELVVVFREGDVDSPEAAVAAYYARKSN